MKVTHVDLKPAFDSVDRKSMPGVGVPSVLMNLIIDLQRPPECA